MVHPELFVRINEASGDEAERLDAEWEAAGQAGRSYYTEIKDRIPPKLDEAPSSTRQSFHHAIRAAKRRC